MGIPINQSKPAFEHHRLLLPSWIDNGESGRVPQQQDLPSFRDGGAGPEPITASAEGGATPLRLCPVCRRVWVPGSASRPRNDGAQEA